MLWSIAGVGCLIDCGGVLGIGQIGFRGKNVWEGFGWSGVVGGWILFV